MHNNHDKFWLLIVMVQVCKTLCKTRNTRAQQWPNDGAMGLKFEMPANFV